MIGKPGERIPLFTRGFLGFFSLIGNYIALRLIPLSDATTIYASSPVFVSIVACVILHEEYGIFQAFTIIITLAGVLLISRPTFIFAPNEAAMIDEKLRMEGIIVSVLACIASTITYVCIRKLQKTPSVVVVNMYSIFNIICSIIVVLIVHFGLGAGGAEGSKFWMYRLMAIIPF